MNIWDMQMVMSCLRSAGERWRGTAPATFPGTGLPVRLRGLTVLCAALWLSGGYAEAGNALVDYVVLSKSADQFDCADAPAAAPACRVETLLGAGELRDHLREGRSLVRSEDTLTFIHAASEAEVVRMRGGLQYPLSRVAGTNLWTVTLRIAELDRLALTYAFAVDGKVPSADDIEWRGEDAQPPPAMAATLDGTLVEHTLRGQGTFGARTVSVYEPPRAGTEPVHAVIFMADGNTLPNVAKVVEPLVVAAAIPRVRLVGIHAGQGKRRAHEYIYGLTKTNAAFLAHEQFLLEDVLPFIERKYPSAPGAMKVIMGYSNGGDLAVAVATRNPDRFDAAIVLSPAWPAPGEWARRAGALAMLLGAGTLEPSFHKAAVGLSQRFADAGVLHALEVRVGGHEMMLWRALIPDALAWTFAQEAVRRWCDHSCPRAIRATCFHSLRSRSDTHTAGPCSASGLSRLVLEGHELHPSLKTRQLDDKPLRHVPRSVLRRIPQHSTDAEFVQAVARGGSQGKLGGEGIRSALYALYLGESDVGFYGLEAASAADADRLEDALRKVWAHNVSIDRARVHRTGLELVVVWTDGVPSETWEAVNASVAQRLLSP